MDPPGASVAPVSAHGGRAREGQQGPHSVGPSAPRSVRELQTGARRASIAWGEANRGAAGSAWLVHHYTVVCVVQTKGRLGGWLLPCSHAVDRFPGPETKENDGKQRLRQGVYCSVLSFARGIDRNAQRQLTRGPAEKVGDVPTIPRSFEFCSWDRPERAKTADEGARRKGWWCAYNTSGSGRSGARRKTLPNYRRVRNVQPIVGQNSQNHYKI